MAHLSVFLKRLNLVLLYIFIQVNKSLEKNEA